MLNSLIRFLLMFAVVACSTNDLKVEKGSNELIEDFNVSKNQIDKFETKWIEKKTPKKETLEQPNSVKDPSPAKKVARKKLKPPKKTQIKKEVPSLEEKSEKRAHPTWSNFRPNIFVGEKIVFRITYLGLTVGDLEMYTLENKEIGGVEVFHHLAKLKSADYYSFIYSLNNQVETFVSTNNYLPVKYSLIQRESRQDIDDLQLFDHEKRKTFYWYKRIKNKQIKKENQEKEIPAYFQDFFSSIYFMRSLPLKLKDKYEFPVVTRGKIWNIKLKVSKTEKISIMDKSIKSIKIDGVATKESDPSKKGKFSFWYSDDEKKIPLKFAAKIKIGNVFGEVVNLGNGTED